MSEFTPDCLVDTIGSYQNWSASDYHRLARMAQILAAEKCGRQVVKHEILSGNGLGSIQAEVRATLTKGDECSVELALTTSSFGVSNEQGDVASVEQSITLTVDQTEIKKLADFFTGLNFMIQQGKVNVER